MSTFGRNLVPISGTALSEIDAQAARTLRTLLSARKFVDVEGPKGWDFAGVSIGRLRDLSNCDAGACSGVREFLPAVESRVSFELPLFELHNVDRGAKDPDLTAVEKAATAAAKFEEDVIYNGFEKAGVKGLLQSCANNAVSVPTGDPNELVAALAGIVRDMKVRDSIGGPYALVGGCKLRAAIHRVVDGRTVFEAIKKTTDIDEFICTPLHEEAFVASKRGGDFELTLGGDYTVGFEGACEKSLKFFLTELFTFRILEPRAYTPITLK